MKKWMIIIAILLLKQFSFAQKQTERLIDNDDRKKLIKARNLFNQSQVFDGEKIIRELIRTHPNQVYFYEALVQTQKQVLDRIMYATDEWQQLSFSKSMIDSINKDIVKSIDDEIDDEDDDTNSSTPIKNENEMMESLGIDMTDINTKKKESKNENSKRTKEKVNKEEETESLSADDFALEFSQKEREEIKNNSEQATFKLDKKTKKKLKIIENFAQIPYSTYLYDMLENARKATRLFQDADSSSVYLRQYLIDTVNVNAEVKKEAWDEYLIALEDYYAKEIPAAASHLEKALLLDEIFYSAHLKMGDVYYLMNKDSMAVVEYKYASVLEPTNPTPLEKLSAMFYNKGQFEESAAFAIEAIMKYPHAHLFKVLGKILEKTGRELNTQWIKREVYPLKTKNINEEIVVDDKSPWWHYQSVKQDVFNFYDTSGVVVPNEKTQERYLEVYAWKKMLNNTSPKHFQFARAMEKMGYLDCYVLISLFHIDLYSQFIDIVKTHPEKVKKYFYILINWDDSRFDKIKKSLEVKKSNNSDSEKKPSKPENKK
ncbi:MAG TPA: hypothetical protein PKA54_01900 [Chitinophagaceae bacterium]|nr:hypothetical protein [Chitinophagaceae bacterium]